MCSDLPRRPALKGERVEDRTSEELRSFCGSQPDLIGCGRPLGVDHIELVGDDRDRV